MKVEAGLMKPFYGASRSWIDEKITLSLEAGLIQKL